MDGYENISRNYIKLILTLTEGPNFFKAEISPSIQPSGITAEAARGRLSVEAGVGPKKTQNAFPGAQ